MTQLEIELRQLLDKHSNDSDTPITLEDLVRSISDLKASIIELQTTIGKTELIDRVELRKRLNISEPTAIYWGKRGRIPEIRIGGNVLYNWAAVIKALEDPELNKMHYEAKITESNGSTIPS